jgi:hypothetical protein
MDGWVVGWRDGGEWTVGRTVTRQDDACLRLSGDVGREGRYYYGMCPMLYTIVMAITEGPVGNRSNE